MSYCWNLAIFMMLPFLPSVVAGDKDGSMSNNNPPHQHSVYVIGDLHGDIKCAKYWVEQTGLVNPSSWTWTDPTSTLVFMGDYVDKGPTSKQTVEYVKSLTESFPQNVVALMGNHELELLLDRDSSRTVWDGHGYHQLVYASVHPEEYLNYLLPADHHHDDPSVDDNIIMDALYNATLEVYGQGQYRSVYMIPDLNPRNSIVQYVQPPSLRPLVSQRLRLYQQRYLDAFRSNTPLGSWLESRPVAHVSHDGTIFVHGGIPMQIATQYLARGKADVEMVNRIMKQHAQEKHLPSFMEETELGQVIYAILIYRGNHRMYHHDDADQQEAASSCTEMQQILSSMEGIVRMGVGHTPGDTVRLACNNTFMALDSALGRWIRAMGNEYCRGDEMYMSSNGRFVCDKIESRCEGQIVRIDRDGTVQVLDEKEMRRTSELSSVQEEL